MIKLVVFDIDGVLTDGTVIIGEDGHEQKKINLRDIDAVYQIHRQGFKIAAITGEETSIVGYFEKRFPWEDFVKGCKNKVDALKKICDKCDVKADEICYVGDGKYDIEPLCFAGIGICPSDAIDDAKKNADIILKSSSGTGGLWEIISILHDINDKNSAGNYFFDRVFKHAEIFKKMSSDVDMRDKVMKVAENVINIQKNGGQVFLCGNGGSAADAQHIATEFISRFYKDRPAMNAEALSVNTSTLTAVSNDYSYDRVFVRQLQAKARTGDMLIGISTSGKSKNVIEALRYAKNNGVFTVMLMGEFCYRELDEICDVIIKVPSIDTPRIQEAHIFIGHLIAEYVEYVLYGN